MSSTMMCALREATGVQHQRLSGVPFAASLADGRLPRESYVGYLRAMAIVHSTLEARLAACRNPLVAAVWHEGLRKLPLLERDLSHFPSHLTRDIPAAVSIALRLARQLRVVSVENPVALLGCLYVLEGSTRGAEVLRPQVQRALGLPGPDGLAYLSNYGDGASAAWSDFSRRMDAAVLDDAQRSTVLLAAREFYDALIELFERLYPFDESTLRFCATALNCDAGVHEVPQDPRVLLAAIAAGERAWREHPYFEARYGRRGVRYTRSDSAWLASLTRLDEAPLDEQVRWLGEVLATRGMPRLLLERHLAFLADALLAAVPAERAAYQKLHLAAERLRGARESLVAPATAAALAREFRASTDPGPLAAMPEAPELLLSAVADERAGIPDAARALSGWLLDARRFPPRWIAAGQRLLRDAREARSDELHA